jgi:predicted nucleic acid-binding protein
MPTERPTVYIETSVVSYYTARPSGDLVVAAHQHITHKWWEERLPGFDGYVSELVRIEAQRGDPMAAQRRLEAMARFDELPVTEEAERLAAVYLQELPIPVNARQDALHLALAAVNAMDYLVTWNCRHIAHGTVMKVLPGVTERAGYGAPVVCTPQELVYDSREMD